MIKNTDIMKKVNMAKYSLVLDVNLSQVRERLEEGQTFDEYIGKNFFHLIADKLEELGIEGGVGFQHYAHHYTTHRPDEVLR